MVDEATQNVVEGAVITDRTISEYDEPDDEGRQWGK